MKPVALVALIFLSGCAVSKSCFVGFSVLPLGPILICGIDTVPPEKAE